MFRLLIATAAMLWSVGAYAQQFSIYGKVRGAEPGGHALQGATIEVKELGRLVVTDEFGNFRVTKVPEGEITIVVRYLGYHEKVTRMKISGNHEIDFSLEESSQLTDEVVVLATRANDKTPMTFFQVGKQAIQQQNFGQDLPLLLNWSPSMVTTTDAGAGIGYTGLRIRGSDPTRINVTINGIALNDSESQGVFWVNTPDLASSIQTIQIQRGVGTSTNGPGAFGATVSVNTDGLSQNPYAEATVSVGSFGSQRYTFKGGTGLINKHWSFDGRISNVSSDGYVDRATSNLNSFYLSGGYYGEKTIVKAIVFGGSEKTYQAWYGVDPATMEISRTYNYAGAIYNDDGSVSRFYDNEVDDYKQDHYQLHLSHVISDHWNANLSLHYTDGRGYFEQYKQSEPFVNLGLPDVNIGDSVIQMSDVIVRRWLDNDYYGATFSTNYSRDNTDLTFGGAISRYDNARHFGEIVWAQISDNIPVRFVYYDGESEKTDMNLYAKWSQSFGEKFSSYIDIQYRHVTYETAGTDNDQMAYDISDEFSFLNPKIGFTYAVSPADVLYSSYAIANREPSRTDYLEGTEKPRREKLGNLEIGWRRTGQKFNGEFNYYLMNYTDQLVLTGAVSDTGYPIRSNVGKSYRTGIELSGTVGLPGNLTWSANVTGSINKNKDFIVLDENNVVSSQSTTIILSPSWIAGSQLEWKPFENFQVAFLSKYVGQQYLDNTENELVKLGDYFINDVRLSLGLKPRGIKGVDVGLLVNNIFDVEYSSNGYGYGGTAYYFPQAGTNFMAMLTVKI
jgi:iron complex outermembrane recepter protein